MVDKTLGIRLGECLRSQSIFVLTWLIRCSRGCLNPVQEFSGTLSVNVSTPCHDMSLRVAEQWVTHWLSIFAAVGVLQLLHFMLVVSGAALLGRPSVPHQSENIPLKMAPSS